MNNTNQAKAEKLGMPFGTATARLRKSLLFYVAGLANLLDCYRCGELIETEEEFTIEHKVAWFNSVDPVKYFFDINNISFSHSVCNNRAALRPHKIYASIQERRRAGFARYYAKPDKKEAHLARKRRRYAERYGYYNKHQPLAQSG
jgi:hypothetical protein